jgi:hypothetical protein
MATKKVVSSLVILGVLAASVSTAALADDHRSHDRGNGALIAAGIITAVVIGTMIANSNSEPAPQAYVQQPPPNYGPPQAYYPPQPVQQGYYGAPQPVYVEGGYYERPEYRRHPRYYRDGYYSR